MSAYSDLTAIARSEGGTGSKACIARGFGSASGTYDSASRLQKAMGDTMLARIPENFEPTSILDLGCGTGWFTRKLANQYRNAAVTGADLTFSNLMIQWSTRPDTVLAECQRILKPGGTLAISTLLHGTLEELKQAWTKADPGQPHVNRFTHHADWQQITSRQLPGSTLETATLTLPYDSPMALNRELKHLGAVFKGEERRRTITAPGRFKAMCTAYPKQGNGEIIASYHAGWLYWTKAT